MKQDCGGEDRADCTDKRTEKKKKRLKFTRNICWCETSLTKDSSQKTLDQELLISIKLERVSK